MNRHATVRERILAVAAHELGRNPGAPVETLAAAAGVSRATFYRHFGSRAALLAALDIQAGPGSRERVLAAAVELIGRDGLRGMSMDELAERAGVSRASVYRLFAGKAALFDALIEQYSPFAEISDVIERLADRPPEEVLPAIASAIAPVYGPRLGILRSLFFEVASLTPDALPGADPRIRELLGQFGHYIAAQMAAGRLRQMHPLIAAQLFMGPIVFHLVTRPELDRLGVLHVPIERAVDELARGALRALAPTTQPQEGNA
jgi:AcrR family transcriptional regulator